MPCLLGLLALATPRFVIVLVVLFSDFIGRAYEGIFWPLLGFFFMPITTLAYAGAMNWNGSVSGGYFVMVLLAVFLDLGLLRDSNKRRRTVRVETFFSGRGPGGGAASGPHNDDRIYDADPRDLRG